MDAWWTAAWTLHAILGVLPLQDTLFFFFNCHLVTRFGKTKGKEGLGFVLVCVGGGNRYDGKARVRAKYRKGSSEKQSQRGNTTGADGRTRPSWQSTLQIAPPPPFPWVQEEYKKLQIRATLLLLMEEQGHRVKVHYTNPLLPSSVCVENTSSDKLGRYAGC